MISKSSYSNLSEKIRLPRFLIGAFLTLSLILVISPFPVSAGDISVNPAIVKQVVHQHVTQSKSNLTAGDVSSFINMSLTPEYGTKKVFNPAGTKNISAAALSPTKFVVVYCDEGHGSYGTAVIGEISGNKITYGAETVFNAVETVDVSTAALSSNQFVVAFGDSKLYTILGAVSGNSIAFGTKAVFRDGCEKPGFSTTALSTTKFLVAYRELNYGYVIIGEVSGTTIKYGAAKAFDHHGAEVITTDTLSPTKFVVAYCDPGEGWNLYLGTAVIGEVSGNSIAFGALTVFNRQSHNISVAALTTDKFVVAYRDWANGYRGTSIIGEVSGNKITYGAEVVFNPAETYYQLSAAALSSSKFIVSYCDSGSKAIIGEVSGNTITYGTKQFFSGKGSQFSVVALSPSNFVVAYRDEDNNGKGTAVAGRSSSSSYLAEGSTAWGFDCYITIENPNDREVNTIVTYMVKGEGSVDGGELLIPANSQMTIRPADALGQKDFSTRVACTEDVPIAVDRTMTWMGEGAASPEGHCSIGVAAPDNVWYLPEGSASWGFECWLLIQNPNDTEAICQVTYMIENIGPRTVEKKVPANSRESFNMAEDLQDIQVKDASIKVESNVPVIPERAMYRNSRREGHDSIGTNTPANDYYLAEGAAGYKTGFTTWVLVQNPNDTPNKVTLTFLTGSGEVHGPTKMMEPNSRWTVKVNDYVPYDTDVSTHVHGDWPIIAERAMYWDGGLGEACHDSIGMASAHSTFYLPDGQTSEGRETWTLVSNPNDSDVKVRISYLTPSGAGNVVFEETIPAASRQTFNMADKIPSGRAAVMVESLTSGKKIMCERAMYWNSRGAGTDTIGGFSD